MPERVRRAPDRRRRTRHSRHYLCARSARLAQRQAFAEAVHNVVVRAGHLIGRQCHLMRPPRSIPAALSSPLRPGHALSSVPKSSGTSPKVFRITASPNSPRFGSPLREKATAPALDFSQDIASARQIAAARLGHSAAWAFNGLAGRQPAFDGDPPMSGCVPRSPR
jgi:hypothetical protein